MLAMTGLIKIKTNYMLANTDPTNIGYRQIICQQIQSLPKYRQIISRTIKSQPKYRQFKLYGTNIYIVSGHLKQIIC